MSEGCLRGFNWLRTFGCVGVFKGVFWGLRSCCRFQVCFGGFSKVCCEFQGCFLGVYEGVFWVSGVCLRWFGFFKGFWGASQCKWGFQGGLRGSNSVTSFQD